MFWRRSIGSSDWDGLTSGRVGGFLIVMLLRAMIDRRGHIDLGLVASALCPAR
jgi:hypothetical protein